MKLCVTKAAASEVSATACPRPGCFTRLAPIDGAEVKAAARSLRYPVNHGKG